MSLLVNVMKRKVLAGEDAGQEKWYGQVVAADKISFDKICEQVSHYSMATHADVSGVIKDVMKHMADILEEGKSVNLGRMGDFRLNAGSKGVKEEKDFTLHLMKKPKVIFRPGKVLRRMMRNVTYVRQKVKVVIVPAACKEEHI